MSTFSKIRVGTKKHLAGSAKLVLFVDTSSAGVVGTLPKGAIVVGAVADQDAVAVTVGSVTLTTVTAGTGVEAVPGTQDNPVITVTNAVASSNMAIEYFLQDSLNGVYE